MTILSKLQYILASFPDTPRFHSFICIHNSTVNGACIIVNANMRMKWGRPGNETGSTHAPVQFIIAVGSLECGGTVWISVIRAPLLRRCWQGLVSELVPSRRGNFAAGGVRRIC